MEIRDIINCEKFKLEYRNMVKNINFADICYLEFIKEHREMFHTTIEVLSISESEVNEKIVDWYPIKRTSKNTWHMAKERLARKGLLEEESYISYDKDYKGAVVLMRDFDAIVESNKDSFNQCKRLLDRITEYLKSY